MKENKGITLIALVITIIVLIILAGISINLLLGENGLLGKAKESKIVSEMAQTKEDVALMLTEYNIERYTTGITLEEFLTKKNVDFEADGDTSLKIEKDGYVLTINKVTLEIDGPVKTTKSVKISLNKNIVEPGETVTATLTLGEDVDITKCKYSLQKQTETPSVTNQVTSTTISVTAPNEKADYYFYILVGYKNSSETTLKKASVKVNVEVTGVTLNKASTDLVAGQTDNLTAVVEPSASVGQTVTWNTSNSNIATVNGAGVVTAVSKGTAQITATSTEDPSKSATCTVTVTQPATITYIVDGSTYATNTEKSVGDTLGTLPTNPSATGKTFKGWYDETSGGTQYTTSSLIDKANLTLYAHWTCTVTFDSNEGTSVAPQTVDYGTAATQPTAPTKQNNVLVGWYSDSGLTQSYNFSTAVTGDITLYAKWRFEGQLSGANVGDYVDIGVSYTCQMTSGYSGWRVLDDGSETGTVKLISAGCPLKYYFKNYYNQAIPELENLYTTLASSGSNNYFTASGFANNTYNMTSVFGSNSYVDISAGTSSIYAPSYTQVGSGYDKRGTIWAIDKYYWLSSHSVYNQGDGYLDCIGSNNYASQNAAANVGIRMIVTLKSTVRVSSSNTGNGSANSPWTLSVN